MDIGSIGVDEPFSDYGVDAITGIHLVQVISKALMIELEAASIFGYNSVNQLTSYILLKYKNQSAKALGQNLRKLAVNNNLAAIIREKKSAKPKANAVPGIVKTAGQTAGKRVKEIIAEKVSQILKADLSLIDTDESFDDYGINAITGIRLVQAINKALKIELETINIVDHNSVEQLTNYILDKFKDTVAIPKGQNIKQADLNKDVTPDNQENPVNSYPNPFIRKKMFIDSDVKEKEKIIVKRSPRRVSGIG